MNLKFGWDKSKARSNYAKHGVSFDLAKGVFKDPFAIEFLDDRQDYGEERFVMIGMVEDHLLYVAYTERDEIIRFISARRATKHEEQVYFQQNTQGDSSDDADCD
ncbi:MAG: BrnT family toxin [Terriglobia bacterium]|jgi:hypothetical protein